MFFASRTIMAVRKRIKPISLPKMKNGMVHICIPKSSDIIPHFAVKVVLPIFYNSGCYIHFIKLKFHLMKNY
jgi:hypothetical protein